jgi:hypothetical protein
MRELNVQYLDIYDAYYFSGAWTKVNDPIHYAGSTLATLLISYFWPGLLDQFEYCNETITVPTQY